ncbi:MAG: DUF7342 family protein [Halococcoides sp.]
MGNSDDASDWTADRTTFQRVYDVLLGTTSFRSADEIADRADCSDAGARSALDQLVEMGVADRRSGRPATYRRNDSYLTWKRVETLAQEHTAAELRDRVRELITEDETFQAEFGVPDPDAVTEADLASDDARGDQDALEDRWTVLNDWRTIRRDVRVLRRAAQRASRAEDGARA